jgi:hypothetical protein
MIDLLFAKSSIGGIRYAHPTAVTILSLPWQPGQNATILGSPSGRSIEREVDD